MNINDVSSVLKPVEPPIPVSEPDKLETAEKSNIREKEEQKKEFSIEETNQLAEELNEYMRHYIDFTYLGSRLLSRGGISV